MGLAITSQSIIGPLITILLLVDVKPNLTVKKPRWKRWGWWTFIVLNVAFLLLIIPLLKAVTPLMEIWWNTRSQASFQRHERQVARAKPNASTTRPNPTDTLELAPVPDTAANNPLQSLTNQVQMVSKLSDKEISQIIAWKFGSSKKPKGDPSKFDTDSAVFDKITRTVVTFQDKPFYCYEIDLVDQNGNHKVTVDCFSEPNLEYERSKATMELVNNTPQLKKIYDAFSHVLAEQSTVNTNAPEVTNMPNPVIRFEKGATPE